MENIVGMQIKEQAIAAYCEPELVLSSCLDYIYPVGSLYFTSDQNFNPEVSFGGKWRLIPNGLTIIGEGSSIDSNEEERTFEINEQGGEFNHQLLTEELPKHRHTLPSAQLYNTISTGMSVISYMTAYYANDTYNTSDVGNSAAHNNMMPYEAKNIWERYE